MVCTLGDGTGWGVEDTYGVVSLLGGVYGTGLIGCMVAR